MRSALGFLTVVGGAATPDRRAPAWFGPVGAALGLAVGGAWWVAGELWPPLVAALLAVAVDAALTGMLHFDGLADSADGLLPPLDRARRLEVMATPDIGAFGGVVVTLVVVARVAALAALAPDPLLVAGLWAASRASMALALASLPYARAGRRRRLRVPGRAHHAGAGRAGRELRIGGLGVRRRMGTGCAGGRRQPGGVRRGGDARVAAAGWLHGGRVGCCRSGRRDRGPVGGGGPVVRARG